MPASRLRRARLSDVDTLVLHRRGMWQDIGKHSQAELDGGGPIYRRWIAARLKSGKAAGFIVEVGGKPVASGVLWVQEVQPRPGLRQARQGYLLSMYTEPAHRGRGHAGAIVDASLAWARSEGLERVALHAAPMGRKLYERAGFRRTWEMRIIFDTPKRRAKRRARRER